MVLPAASGLQLPSAEASHVTQSRTCTWLLERAKRLAPRLHTYPAALVIFLHVLPLVHDINHDHSVLQTALRELHCDLSTQ